MLAAAIAGGAYYYLTAEERARRAAVTAAFERASKEMAVLKEAESSALAAVHESERAHASEKAARDAGDMAKLQEAQETVARAEERIKSAQAAYDKALAALRASRAAGPGGEERREVERTDYQPPPQKDDEVLADDRLEDRKPAFDPVLVDRRLLRGEWLLNASAAVLRLDVPAVKPDQEAELLVLHPSYAAATKSSSPGRTILPSVNLIDGKAKQFDDGLYAAIDLAHYRGLKERLQSHVRLVERIAERAGKSGPAAPFLAAGLELAGVTVSVASEAEKAKLLEGFRSDEIASKPIGFYTWNEELSTLYRFMRFFQRSFGGREAKALEIPGAIAAALGRDGALLADYERSLAFYARLSNPHEGLSLADIRNLGALDGAALERVAREKGARRAAVAVFPPRTSKETVLFEKLFPQGVPPDVDLMKELVKRIRSGEVDLKPGAGSGWYEHQVYALETLLLPEKGPERDKLLLTREYKKRMLEAFKALVTKRRETHVRELALAKAKSESKAPPPPAVDVAPRLRLEPAPTYYLRTARAYAFLANFLEASLGKDALRGLRGLKQDGARERNLYEELSWMRDFFYGLYLVAAEDIGMKTNFAAGEPVDEERTYKLAADWLARAMEDADLGADTRVAVPVYVDPFRGVTRLWLTLGVRLTKLDADYARAPSVKRASGGEWKTVERRNLEGARYLIAVDEFAEVQLKGMRVLSREELRAICDREKTKEAILEALRK